MNTDSKVKLKESFEEPLYEVVHIAATDIIRTSGDDLADDEL